MTGTRYPRSDCIILQNDLLGKDNGNDMKRIFGLTVLTILLTVINASAESEIFISATHTADTDGKLSHSISVRAGLDIPNANTMLVIRDSQNNTVEINQAYADEKGDVSYSFRVDAAGSYIGFINTEEERVKNDFAFEILADYGEVADAFNGAGEESIEAVIDQNADKLLFDTKYYTEEVKPLIAQRMLKECGGMEITDINEAFDKSVIETYLYGEFEMQKKAEVIEYYDSAYLGVIKNDEAENLYSSFCGFKEEVKEKVLELTEAEKPGLEGFSKAFNKSVLRTAFLMLDAEELDGFILNNLDYMELDGYRDLTPSKRKDIILLMKKSDAETAEEFADSYDEALEELDEENKGSSKPSGGGSSGGSGGGSGSGGTVWVAPKVEEVKKSEETSEEKTEAEAEGFSDMESAVWAEEAVNALYKKGILKGKGEGLFAPKDNVTRAEFAVMIVNAFIGVDENAKCSFSDIADDDWCRKYVATAYSKGIIYGLDDGSFGKNTNITREDMAAILHRVLSFTKALPVVENINNTISDFDTISEYAKNSVLMLSELKIVSGVGNGEFLPKKNATRAEAAVMINNAMGVSVK